MIDVAPVVEAEADARTATALARKILTAQPQWRIKTWVQVSKEGKTLGRRIHGKFDGNPGDCDARAARTALMLFRHGKDPVRAIVLIRDADLQAKERQKGLEQARQEHAAHSPLPVIIGLAIPKREAWILAGFSPNTSEEKQRLQTETQRLGFDPSQHPDRITASTHGAKTDIKVVVKILGIDPEREDICLKDSSIATLRSKGAKTGLPEFLEELTSKLQPVIAAAS